MQAEVVNNMKTLRITDCSSRYFGPASTFHLVSAALYVKAKSDETQGNAVQENMVYDQYRDNYRDHIQKLSWDIMPVRAFFHCQISSANALAWSLVGTVPRSRRRL